MTEATPNPIDHEAAQALVEALDIRPGEELRIRLSNGGYLWIVQRTHRAADGSKLMTEITAARHPENGHDRHPENLAAAIRESAIRRHEGKAANP